MAGIAGEATVGPTMIDIRLARDDPDAVKASLARRGVDPADIDLLLDADGRARNAVGRRDELRARVKDLSRQVAEARRAGDDGPVVRLSDESRSLSDEGTKLGAEADAAQAEVRDRLLWLPNLPADDAPDGLGPDDNLVVRRWPDEPRSYADHQRVPHW